MDNKGVGAHLQIQCWGLCLQAAEKYFMSKGHISVRFQFCFLQSFLLPATVIVLMKQNNFANKHCSLKKVCVRQSVSQLVSRLTVSHSVIQTISETTTPK